MSYITNDEQMVLRIRKNLLKLELLYSRIEKQSDTELEDGIDGLALTQCITNLFSYSSRINDDYIAKQLSLLSSGRTVRVCQITYSNHDVISWGMVKNTCQKILQNITTELLEGCLEKLSEENKNVKDYTISNFS
ncbi:MAG: hypothetical protein FWD03_08500 [Defluviitaleaceae bacterium]|nr:hypothetical protein [Defluviitaleaceae bacterium]